MYQLFLSIQQHSESTVTRAINNHTYSMTTEERVKITIIANRRKPTTANTTTLYESNNDLISEPPGASPLEPQLNSPLPIFYNSKKNSNYTIIHCNKFLVAIAALKITLSACSSPELILLLLSVIAHAQKEWDVVHASTSV